MKVAARRRASTLNPTPDRPARSARRVSQSRVLDTSALIGWPLPELSGGFVVPAQEDELLRVSPDRGAIFAGLGLVVSEPSAQAVSSASDAARASGDMSGLSEIDLSLIALALERSALLVTDDYRMQNIATALGVEWRAVGEAGISEVWSWELRCVGCGATQAAPDSPNERRNDYGNCRVCGAALRLKKQR